MCREEAWVRRGRTRSQAESLRAFGLALPQTNSNDAKERKGGKSLQFPSTHEMLLFFQVPFQALVTFMQKCDVVVNTARP